MHKLATILREERYKAGAINFDSQEVKFILDENAKPIGVYIKESKEANWLIEEFMLLANKKVAEHVGMAHKGKAKGEKSAPAKTFVYRVHDEPNPEKLNTFVEFVAKLGYKMRVNTRQALASSYNNLAFDYYTHFTSPIRRYPDLMVHRLLERYLNGGASVSADEYEEYCKHCSVAEKRAADAERASVKYKQAEWP